MCHSLKSGFPVCSQILTYSQSQGNVFWEIKLWLGSIWLDLDRPTAERCGLVQQTDKPTDFSSEQHPVSGNRVGERITDLRQSFSHHVGVVPPDIGDDPNVRLEDLVLSRMLELRLYAMHSTTRT